MNVMFQEHNRPMVTKESASAWGLIPLLLHSTEHLHVRA